MANIHTDLEEWHTQRGGEKLEKQVTAFVEIADDLAGLQQDTISAADATDLATAITLVNELKAKLVAQAAYTIKTVKVS
jgi:hypothetical protein